MVARFVVLAALIVVVGIRQAAAQEHPRRTDRRRVRLEDAADNYAVAAPGCARTGKQWDRCGVYYVDPHGAHVGNSAY
jgi:hypothetical protein